MHTINGGLKIMKEQIETDKEPKIISSGVILFYRNKTENPEVLLIKNKKSGLWGFPKGHVENKETLIETAIREVKEEIGLEINHLEEKPCFKSKYIDDNNNNKRVFYFLKKINKIVPQLNTEIEDYMWVNLEKAYEILVFPELKKIIKKIKQILE